MRTIGPLNVWDSPEELEARREAGRALARRHFGDDPAWQNRLANLAQHLGHEKWELCQRLEKKILSEVVERMCRYLPLEDK